MEIYSPKRGLFTKDCLSYSKFKYYCLSYSVLKIESEVDFLCICSQNLLVLNAFLMKSLWILIFHSHLGFNKTSFLEKDCEHKDHEKRETNWCDPDIQDWQIDAWEGIILIWELQSIVIPPLVMLLTSNNA